MTATQVVHYGNAPGGRGGVSSVIRAHLARRLPGFEVASVATYDPEGRDHLRRNRPVLRAVVDVLRRPRGTIVHCHLSQRGSLAREGAIALLARARGLRVVLTLHGSSLAGTGRTTVAAVRALTRCAHVVHGFAGHYRDRFRVPASRWRTIPNDVAVPGALPSTPRERVVVFAGEVGVRKGVDVLLEAWTRAGNDEWTLVLAGPLAAGFELPSALPAGVDVRGPVPHADVLDLLERARVVVQPSRAEAFPVTVCEALARGCAVVGTPVGAMGELLEAAGQRVVATGDAAALARALDEVRADERALEAQGAEGRRYALATLSSAAVQPLWLELYRTARGER